MGLVRIKLVVFGAMLGAGTGVLAIHADPPCVNFVRTYVTKPVRNTVSAATAAAWAKWRVGHPNWKPKPGVVRPKYKMSREEIVKKVDFACAVPVAPETLTGIFPLTDLEIPPPAIELPPMRATQIEMPGVPPTEVAEESLPPELSQIQPGGQTPGDVYPPYFPSIPGTFPPPPGKKPVVTTTQTVTPPVIPPVPPAVTPEPSSFVLLALGIAAAGFLFKRGHAVSR
jgi:hypothetical protein